VDAGDIAAFLRGQLAHYKQPQGIEFVETIPKSASGKILRRILKDTYGKAGRS
jgi:acyl-coenzyme A synthetase/AMP-(fatty) acid ligase